MLTTLGLIVGVLAVGAFAYRASALEAEALRRAWSEGAERILGARVAVLQSALVERETARLDELPGRDIFRLIAALEARPGRWFAVAEDGRVLAPGSPPALARTPRPRAAQEALARAAGAERLGEESLAVALFRAFLAGFPGHDLPQGRPYAAFAVARLASSPAAAETALLALEIELAAPALAREPAVVRLYRRHADSLASAHGLRLPARDALRARAEAAAERERWRVELGDWLAARMMSELARGGARGSFPIGTRRCAWRRVERGDLRCAVGFVESREEFRAGALRIADSLGLCAAPEADPEAPRAALAGSFPELELALSDLPEDPALVTLEARRFALAAIGIAALVLLLLGPLLLWRQSERALELSRMQADFVAGISHELRTPLSLIRAVAETLQLGHVRSEEERQSYLGMLCTETERLSALVGNVLDFSRAARGTVRYALAPIDLAAELTSFAETYGPALAGDGSACELALEPGLPPVRADTEALRRALLNLLDNARKFAGPAIRLSAGPRDGGVEIAVLDRGPGVPGAERERIFAAFARGEDARRSGKRGTGLGLALVRQIAAGHGGRAGMRAREGGGSAFWLWLPGEDT